MPICVVVLDQNQEANQLSTKLKEAEVPIIRCQLVLPQSKSKINFQSTNDDSNSEPRSNDIELKPFELDTIELLNPKLARQTRQKSMALWLMPFGLIAGLTFSQMTGLQTFAKLGLGLGAWSEPVFGGILGMVSGWIGSFAAAGSVNQDKNEDIRSLRKLNEDGYWLLLLETPVGIELPWQLVKQSKPVNVVRLSEL